MMITLTNGKIVVVEEAKEDIKTLGIRKINSNLSQETTVLEKLKITVTVMWVDQQAVGVQVGVIIEMKGTHTMILIAKQRGIF